MKSRRTQIIVALLLFIGNVQIYAQRMAPGKIGVEVIAGSCSAAQPEVNYVVSVALTVNGSNGSYQLWGMEYSHRQANYGSRAIPLEVYTFEGGYSLRLVSDRAKSISLNAALGGVIGYETYNRGIMQFPGGPRPIGGTFKWAATTVAGQGVSRSGEGMSLHPKVCSAIL